MQIPSYQPGWSPSPWDCPQSSALPCQAEPRGSLWHISNRSGTALRVFLAPDPSCLPHPTPYLHPMQHNRHITALVMLKTIFHPLHQFILIPAVPFLPAPANAAATPTFLLCCLAIQLHSVWKTQSYSSQLPGGDAFCTGVLEYLTTERFKRKR